MATFYNTRRKYVQCTESKPTQAIGNSGLTFLSETKNKKAVGLESNVQWKTIIWTVLSITQRTTTKDYTNLIGQRWEVGKTPNYRWKSPLSCWRCIIWEGRALQLSHGWWQTRTVKRCNQRIWNIKKENIEPDWTYKANKMWEWVHFRHKLGKKKSSFIKGKMSPCIVVQLTSYFLMTSTSYIIIRLIF